MLQRVQLTEEFAGGQDLRLRGEELIQQVRIRFLVEVGAARIARANFGSLDSKKYLCTEPNSLADSPASSLFTGKGY